MRNDKKTIGYKNEPPTKEHRPLNENKSFMNDLNRNDSQENKRAEIINMSDGNKSESHNDSTSKDGNKKSCNLIKHIYEEKAKKAINIQICFILADLINSDKLNIAELDNEKFMKFLHNVDEKNFNLLKEFFMDDENLSNGHLKVNKLIDEWKNWISSSSTSSTKSGPDEQKLKIQLERHDYIHEVKSNVRIVMSPEWRELKQTLTERLDESKNNNPDELINEYRIGKESIIEQLPSNMFEDEVLELLEPFGPILELNLFTNETTGLSKGYGFVIFSSRQNNKKAIEKLNNYQPRPNVHIKMGLSSHRKKLYVGNLPFGYTFDDLETIFKKLFDGIVQVIVPTRHCDGTTTNISFCFLKFSDMNSASKAFESLQNTLSYECFKGRQLKVDWSCVPFKKLRLHNYSVNVREEDLKKLVEKYGKIESFHYVGNHAYVDYVNTFDAAVAQEDIHNSKFKGQSIIATEFFYDFELHLPFKKDRSNNSKPPHSPFGDPKLDIENTCSNNHQPEANKSLKRKFYVNSTDYENATKRPGNFSNRRCLSQLVNRS